MNQKLTKLQSIPNSTIAVKDNELCFGKYTAAELLDKFGSPLYIYQENVLRDRCRKLMQMIHHDKVIVHYSAKANTNIALLKIIREEGLCADAMSAGEIFSEEKAGFTPDKIFFVCNNIDEEEMMFAVKKGLKISVDSLSQLEMFGRLNPGGKVAVRINPGFGKGHHEKVVTGGDKTKFGVYHSDVEKIKAIAAKYNLHIMGINMHIGSNFFEPEAYIEAVKVILGIARQFEELEFIDAGGGFGIGYKAEEENLDVLALGDKLTSVLKDWMKEYGKEITFAMEPGRYVVCESGIILTKVHSTKLNPGNPPRKFIGTDTGFNVLARPIMYDSYHEIINASNMNTEEKETVDICGNICESGDLLARDRELAPTKEGDTLAILDAGAYGFTMSSNYNCRLKPAEVLITEDGDAKLIRERETLDDLLKHQIF